MVETVCLVIPPSGFLLDERVFMSLGILRVARALEVRKVPVEVLDLSGVSNYLEVVREHLGNTQVRTFGITATSPQLPSAVKITEVIRRHSKESRIILGGPHVTLVNAAYKRGGARAFSALLEITNIFDVLVAGDGEEAVFRALHPQSPALIDADDPISELFLTKTKMSLLPTPARHLVDVESYHYYIDGERALSLIAQLGCPFSCGFCGGRNSPSFRRIRQRETENIVEEMNELYLTYGVRGFMLYDDELNVNRQMTQLMRRIAERQRELGVRWKLRGFIKAELFTDEQAEVMREAGFSWILTGFESGAPRILENIDKKATRVENSRCVEIAHRNGLKVKALMSIGHPGESLETVKQTEKWLLEVRPDDFDITIITTYPGTPYYDEAVLENGGWVYTCRKNGDRLYQVELPYTCVADYYKGRPGEYRAYVSTDHLSSDDLVRERDRLEYKVRAALDIPFPKTAPTLQYEHSMGQSSLPPSILRRST